MKLKIGHRTFSVLPMTATERARYSPAPYGLYSLEEGTIELWPESTACEQADGLVHETLHAIWDVQHLGGTVDEETAVTRLANGLTQVLRDNPHFAVAVEEAARNGRHIFKPAGRAGRAR